MADIRKSSRIAAAGGKPGVGPPNEVTDESLDGIRKAAKDKAASSKQPPSPIDTRPTSTESMLGNFVKTFISSKFYSKESPIENGDVQNAGDASQSEQSREGEGNASEAVDEDADEVMDEEMEEAVPLPLEQNSDLEIPAAGKMVEDTVGHQSNPPRSLEKSQPTQLPRIPQTRSRSKPQTTEDVFEVTVDDEERELQVTQHAKKRAKTGPKPKTPLTTATKRRPGRPRTTQPAAAIRTAEPQPESSLQGAAGTRKSRPNKESPAPGISESPRSGDDEPPNTFPDDESDLNDDFPVTSKAAKNLKAFIQAQELEAMLKSLERVGCSLNMDTERWERKMRHHMLTGAGRDIEPILESLLSTYEAIADARINRDNSALVTARTEAARLMELLQPEVDKILNTRLGNPALGTSYQSEEETQDILRDIYFIIVPKFMEIIKTGLEIWMPQKALPTRRLEEMSELVDYMYKLANKATKQPPTLSVRRTGYLVSKPTRKMLPRLRELRQLLFMELKNRKERAECDRKADELARLQDEKNKEDALNWAKAEQRALEIKKLQRQALDKQLADPFWGPMLRSEIERQQALNAARKAEEGMKIARSQFLRQSQSSSTRSQRRTEAQFKDFVDRDELLDNDEEEEEDPFAEDLVSEIADDYERVTNLFGDKTSNKANEKPQRSWSESERETLITAMRFHRDDPNVFEELEETLDLSRDEVFAMAKDLQEAMDLEHERGKFREPCDEWTFHIWTEQQ